MKGYTKSELKLMLQQIKEGKCFAGVINGYTYGLIEAWTNKLMRVQNYGGMYAKYTISDLKWHIENIFDDCEYMTEVVYDESIRNYRPVDTNLKVHEYILERKKLG